MSVAPIAFVALTGAEVTPAAAATAKTFLNVIAASNRSFRLTEFGIGFLGASGTAKPVLVELCSSTQAGAGSGSSSVTPVAANGDSSVTCQATAAKGYTSEPTTLTAIREWYVHPQAGLVVQFPLGREPSPAVGKALCLRVTFVSGETTVNGRCYMEFEE